MTSCPTLDSALTNAPSSAVRRIAVVVAHAARIHSTEHRLARYQVARGRAVLLHGAVLSPRTFLARARSRRATMRRQRLAERLLQVGLIDAGYLGVQLGRSFGSDAEAAVAWASTEPRLQYAPHPLIEPAWIDTPELSGIRGDRCRSVGPQLALPGERGWVQEAATAIARLSPGDMLPNATGIAPLTMQEALTLAHLRAREFARQNARSLRRHAADFPPLGDVAPLIRPDSSPSDVLVSIVMPVRDRAAVIGAAIDSVRAQSHDRWELLIVDDGSTDGTTAVIADRVAQDARIRLIRQVPTGVSAARNRGIAAARGELVAFLDSDNTWTPEHLVAAVAVVGDGTQRVVHTVVRIRRSDGGLEYAAEQVDRDALLEGRNAVDLNAVVVGRAALHRVGGFDESLRRWVDYDLVLRLSRQLELRLVPVVGVDYDHRLDAPDRITTRESPLWRRVVLERALVDWASLAATLTERVDGVSVVIRSRGRWPQTLATVQHLRSLDPVVDVVVVDAASARSETGILALVTAADPAVTIIRTPWDGGWSLSVELALAETRGRMVLAIEPGARPSADELAAAVAAAARMAGGATRVPHASDGIVLAANVAMLVTARGFDLIDDPLLPVE